MDGAPQWMGHAMELALAMQAEGIEAVPEEYLGRFLALYQGEFERRHPEEGRWALVTDSD